MNCTFTTYVSFVSSTLPNLILTFGTKKTITSTRAIKTIKHFPRIIYSVYYCVRFLRYCEKRSRNCWAVESFLLLLLLFCLFASSRVQLGHSLRSRVHSGLGLNSASSTHWPSAVGRYLMQQQLHDRPSRDLQNACERLLCLLLLV